MTALTLYFFSNTRLPADDCRFTIRHARWATDQAGLRRVRLRVFAKKQWVPEELEWDGEDEPVREELDEAGIPHLA